MFDYTKMFCNENEILEKKSSWWTISSIARLYDPSDRLLNSSFLHNLFAYKITNENFDIKDKRGHYLMTIERSYIQERKNAQS
jgi:hypothetical protein